MAAFDLSSFLAKVSRAPTVRELVKSGDLIDCTVQAAWVGFSVPAYMTGGAWDTVIGSRSRRVLLESEKRDMGVRARNLWRLVHCAINQRRRHPVAADFIELLVPIADKPGRARLEIRALSEARVMYLVVKLTGE